MQNTCDGYNNNMQVYYRYNSCLAATSTGNFVFDLTGINGKTLEIITGASQTWSFTATPGALPTDLCYLNCAGFQYQITVTGGTGTNTQLITLPN
jgi:hypothetical protein